MNKFCKIFAIILSAMLMASMASACTREKIGGLKEIGIVNGSLSDGYDINGAGEIIDDKGNVIDVETDDHGNIIDKETGTVIGNVTEENADSDGASGNVGAIIKPEDNSGTTAPPDASADTAKKPAANESAGKKPAADGGTAQKPSNGGTSAKPGNSTAGSSANKPSDDFEKIDIPADSSSNTKLDKNNGNVDENAVVDYSALHKNPIISAERQVNIGVKPCFNIDTTGFVKNNIKIADLKDKSITLITPVIYSNFTYRDEKGAYKTEWDWYESLKDAYGLKIKYVKSSYMWSLRKNLTYMSAGKQLDVISTSIGRFPRYFNLSQPLDPYINLQNIDNSPGINTMTLEETKWDGTYRCISPFGSVNVLWYNESLAKQFGLTDPHTLWQQGKWNWDTFKTFVTSVPATTPDGKTLYAYNQCTSDMMYSWPLTNGLAPIQIDTKASKPALINNWTNEKTVAAWEFISNTVKSVKFGGGYDHMYSDGTVMMSDAVNLQNQWDNYEYTKGRKFNWVPFPAATSSGGRCIAFDYGYTYMIPKKVTNSSNIPYAVKFMELWATRFSESMVDYLATTKCYNFNYAARKEYFEFAASNTYFGVQMDDWWLEYCPKESETARCNWYRSLINPSYNLRAETENVKNVVQEAIDNNLAYGKTILGP